MFGINGGEFIVLLVVAVLVIGPERLPKYAEQLARFVKMARGFLTEAKSRVDAELGDQVGVDWAKLDPRQYDPRRIVRDALLEPVTRPPAGTRAPTQTRTPHAIRTSKAIRTPDAVGPDMAAGQDAASKQDAAGAQDVTTPGPGVPFDDEAT